MRKSALAVFAVFFLVGCSSSATKPPASKAPTAFAEPQGPMPPLSEKSSFEPSLGQVAAEPAEAPKDAVLMRWDFSKNRGYAYDYAQTVKGVSDMAGQSGLGQNIDGSGTLVVKGEGNETGRMILKDMKIQMKMNIPGKSSVDPMSMDAPTQVMTGIKEDGSMPNGNSSQEALARLLFPLPAKPLKVGESGEIPVQMPFNLAGSVIPATGTTRMTLTRFVKVEGRLCAQLDAVIDISKFKIPSEVETKAQFQVKGKGLALFDIEERRFVVASQALMMSVRVDMPMPKIGFGGKAKDLADKLPKSMRMVTDSDNLITIRWNAQKAKDEAAKP